MTSISGGPDGLDALMMQEEIAGSWGGDIHYTLQPHTARPTALRLTAYWNANEATRALTGRSAHGQVQVGIVVSAAPQSNFFAALYRAYFELQIAVAAEVEGPIPDSVW